MIRRAVHGALRFITSLLAVGTLVRAAAADGELRQGGRVLVRIDHPDADRCDRAPAECDTQLVRQLSGYRFLTGTATSGALIADPASGGRVSEATLVELSAARLPLPSGDFDFGRAEGAFIAPEDEVRVRLVAMEARTALFCTDTYDGSLQPPFMGMIRHFCRRNAVMALDFALGDVQWDSGIDRLAVDWAELGPSAELLGNGQGYARLLRSLSIAATVDARSLWFQDQDRAAGGGDHLSIGGAIEARLRWRSPHWEVVARARHRAPLAGGQGILVDYQSSGKLELVHNLRVGPRAVLRPGLRLGASYAPHPETAVGSVVSVTSRTSFFVGLELGVMHGLFEI